jgi:hypothetical protein
MCRAPQCWVIKLVERESDNAANLNTNGMKTAGLGEVQQFRRHADEPAAIRDLGLFLIEELRWPTGRRQV